MTYTDRDIDTEHAPELDATDARQGRWGRHMLWVLLAGLVLVAGLLQHHPGGGDAGDEGEREGAQARHALAPVLGNVTYQEPGRGVVSGASHGGLP